MEAHEHENQQDWDAAEAAHLRVLALAGAENQAPALFKAHQDLASFYSLRDRREEALEHARAALAAARGAELDILTMMALESLAHTLLRDERIEEVRAAAEEILLLAAADPMYDLQRARALILRARCCVATGELDIVDADLPVAWGLLAPHAAAGFMAGIQSALASWWGVTSRLRAARGDVRAAAVAMREAVFHRRNVAAAPQLEGPYKYQSLTTALQEYSVALLTAGEFQAAREAFEEAQAIRQAIGLSSAGG
jgi:tetratricopeptide (TPR) repeat protein